MQVIKIADENDNQIKATNPLDVAVQSLAAPATLPLPTGAATEASLAKLVTPAKTPITKTVSAENTFSDPLSVDAEHYAALKISGIVAGDVAWLQQSYSSGAWEDIESFTADIAGHMFYVAESNLRLRAGVKTGGYLGGGTILIRLSQG